MRQPGFKLIQHHVTEKTYHTDLAVREVWLDFIGVGLFLHILKAGLFQNPVSDLFRWLHKKPVVLTAANISEDFNIVESTG